VWAKGGHARTTRRGRLLGRVTSSVACASLMDTTRGEAWTCKTKGACGAGRRDYASEPRPEPRKGVKTEAGAKTCARRRGSDCGWRRVPCSVACACLAGMTCGGVVGVEEGGPSDYDAPIEGRTRRRRVEEEERRRRRRNTWRRLGTL